MWNLSDVSDWFNCKTEDGNVVNISSLDYKFYHILLVKYMIELIIKKILILSLHF